MLPDNQNPNSNQNQGFPRPPQVSQPPRPSQPSIEDRLFQVKGVRLMEDDIRQASSSNRQEPSGSVQVPKRDIPPSGQGTRPNDFNQELNDDQLSPENKFELLDDDGIDVPEPSDNSNVKVIAITSVVVISLLLIVGGAYFWTSSKDGGDKMAIEKTPFIEPIEEPEPPVVEEITPIPTIEPTPIVEPVVIPVVEPVVIPVEEPVIAKPSSIIAGLDEIILSIDTKDKEAIIEKLDTIEDELKFGETRHLIIQTTGAKKGFLSFEDFSEIFDLELPEDLSLKNVKWSAYLYHPQKREIDFCKSLSINKSGCSGFRLSLVLNTDSMGDYEFNRKTFEKKIAPSLSNLILAKVGKSQYSFNDANYKKLKLRYRNYPLHQKTTSITSVNYINYKKSGSNLLVIATSRLSFYALLDKLMSKKIVQEDDDEDEVKMVIKKDVQVKKNEVEVIVEEDTLSQITISSVKIKSTTSRSVALNFNTNILAYGSSQLAFTSLKITNQICGDGSIDVEAKTSLLHEVVINGLCPDTAYELIPFAYLGLSDEEHEKTKVFGDRIKVRTSK